MIPSFRRAEMIAAGRGAAVALALCGLACAGAARAQAPLPVPGPAFTHLKYADSLTSVNDRCVITHNRLNPVMHPLYVNGQPVGFC
jgi:hypothetical protein